METGLNRLLHEKSEFDNPADYPDIYTVPPMRENPAKFPPHNQHRANIQTFPPSFQTGGNYPELAYNHHTSEENWFHPDQGEDLKGARKQSSRSELETCGGDRINLDQIL